jgi:mono/diheme cytochrome c family protein
MKRLLRLFVLGTLTFPYLITGCGADPHPAYPAALKYGVRQDPIVKGRAADLGDDRFDPDRPGVFPVMHFEDPFKNPDHPYYNNRQKITDQEILRDPNKIPADKRKEFEDALEQMFGTPRKPTVNIKLIPDDPDNPDGKIALEEAVKVLKIEDDTLAKGSARYRIHCLHCHGLTGDGRGPTARWINPHPRDFRSGKFKFISVNQTENSPRAPARADLLRTLRNGLEGTAMPTFNILPDDELEAMVSYVTHLSIRGKVEHDIIKEESYFARNKDTGVLEWIAEDPANPGKRATILDMVKLFTMISLTRPTDGWASSQKLESAIPVADSKPLTLDELKASVKRGQQFFNAKPTREFILEYRDRLLTDEFKEDRERIKAKKTAEETAKKDKKPDDADYAKIVAKIEATLLAELAENRIKGMNCVSCHADYGRQAKFKFDDWGTLSRPANFAIGSFKGGKRPVDIYYRVHSGINGTPMTNFGKGVGAGRDLWDVVNFVTNLPYPAMRAKLDINMD